MQRTPTGVQCDVSALPRTPGGRNEFTVLHRYKPADSTRSAELPTIHRTDLNSLPKFTLSRVKYGPNHTLRYARADLRIWPPIDTSLMCSFPNGAQF